MILSVMSTTEIVGRGKAKKIQFHAFITSLWWCFIYLMLDARLQKFKGQIALNPQDNYKEWEIYTLIGWLGCDFLCMLLDSVEVVHLSAIPQG